MKVTITDPMTFVTSEVEIDDLANNIAIEVKDTLSRFLGGIWKSRTTTKLIYKENGSIAIGLMFRDDIGGKATKKYRVTIEEIKE